MNEYYFGPIDDFGGIPGETEPGMGEPWSMDLKVMDRPAPWQEPRPQRGTLATLNDEYYEAYSRQYAERYGQESLDELIAKWEIEGTPLGYRWLELRSLLWG